MTIPESRLELDIGNTRIKWRLLQGENVTLSGSDLKADLNFDLGLPLELRSVEAVWVSSVRRSEDEWVATHFNQVGYAEARSHQRGLINAYSNASLMGVDRWLAMLAARHESVTSSHIVVDAGTAITLDLIDSTGQHMGGYICPGLSMMKTALLSGADKVVSGKAWLQGRKPGARTEVCVDHGIQDMAVSWVERHVASMPDAHLSISGGDGLALALLLGREECYKPDLVLDGLKLNLTN